MIIYIEFDKVCILVLMKYFILFLWGKYTVCRICQYHEQCDTVLEPTCTVHNYLLNWNITSFVHGFNYWTKIQRLIFGFYLGLSNSVTLV